VCCVLIFYWSCGSQLTIPAQTPHHDAWGLLAHSAANLRRTRRPLVLFNGCVLGKGLMPCRLGRDAAGRSNCHPYDTRTVKFISVGGAAHLFLAGIRANPKSANDTARALVCITPYRRDMYRFPSWRECNSWAGRSAMTTVWECRRRFGRSVLLWSVGYLDLRAKLFLWTSRTKNVLFAGTLGVDPLMMVLVCFEKFLKIHHLVCFEDTPH
jgi:hypothetical protein